MTPAERTVRRVRALADRTMLSPLHWPEYRRALLDLHGDSAELVLAVLHDEGATLRVLDGVPHLRTHGRLLPLPSFEAADALASVVRHHVRVDVEAEELSEAMRRLGAEAVRRPPPRRRRAA